VAKKKKTVKKELAKRPRAWAVVLFECHARDSLFGPWEDMTAADRNEFIENGPIPCEGGGVPGSWCENCRFGAASILDSDLG
jgi:hypothetical protein